MPYLSKIDIEAIANRIIDQYKLRYIPPKRLCYRVDPMELAEMLGLSVYFRQLSYDHSILGMTAPDEVMVPIFDENKERSIFILDGKTVLIEVCLNHSQRQRDAEISRLHMSVPTRYCIVYIRRFMDRISVCFVIIDAIMRPRERLQIGKNGRQMHWQRVSCFLKTR